MDSEFPCKIADHTLLHKIGRGGFGEVWLTRTIIGSFRAAKIVGRRNFADDRPFTREFDGIRNYEPISRSHQGLVTVLQIGQNAEAGYFYYLMELADDAHR